MNDKPVRLLAEGCKPRALTLVVFAPFGHDDTLSSYPAGRTKSVLEHPLVAALGEVALEGVNVVALIDRRDDYTWLVEAPANRAPRVVSTGKQDMSNPRSLSGVLMHAMNRFRGSAIALTMEGHGAGYLPEIDPAKLKAGGGLKEPDGREFRWLLRPNSEGGAIPSDGQGGTLLPMGESLLPMGESLLPMGESLLPGGLAPGYPISTWGMGWALGEARSQCRAEPLVAVHFNNCFNMAAELLLEIAPHALWATGYANYNFFTSGRAYAEVMRSFAASSRTPGDLARLFAQGNRKELQMPPMKVPHPTIGSAVALERMAGISAALDRLARALVAELKAHAPGTAPRQQLQQSIRAAIRQAQQYDANGSFDLEAPDALTDLLSLAQALAASPLASAAAAQALVQALAPAGGMPIKVYGDNAPPWVAPNMPPWDFSSDTLAMNIYLPDPDLSGVWDWRSPFFFATQPNQVPAQPQVCRLLATTAWAEFVFEYHRGVAFNGLLSAPRQQFPLAWRRRDKKPPGPKPVVESRPHPSAWGVCIRRDDPPAKPEAPAKG